VSVKNADWAHAKGLQLPVATFRLPQMGIGAALGPRITLPLPSFRWAAAGCRLQRPWALVRAHRPRRAAGSSRGLAMRL
jgi:hypothetical protein